ncbi:MAG TPA: HD domain-containing phosphohydrolase [Nannocystaceae bacterium]|nr:HD domain-containing phosphohydrolase [Nannocystaceae bacterium]
MDGPTGDLADFAAVRARVLARASRWGRVDALPGGGLVVTRKRARVAVIDGTHEHPPERYDGICIVAPTAALGDALARISSPRVQVLPLPAPAALVERCVHEALLAAAAHDRARTADRLLEIGVSLNAERDPLRVLQLILAHAREITHADAGSIYLVEGDNERLSFKIADNDSIAANDLSEFTIPVSPSSIVGSTVLTGRTVRVADLYADMDPEKTLPPWTHDRSFDQRSGYQTRSMITTPMIAPDGRVLAVIQLINARKDHDGPLVTPEDFAARIEPFTEEDERLCTALASQGAVALENARLYAEIQALFEGFVRASVHAIEQRDPTTSGHSQRVADLTVALAEAADRAADGPFAATHYSREQLRELEYAGLLHDFGKVGVREEVLIKAKKLYPHQLALLSARFDHMRTALTVQLLEEQLARARAGVLDDADLRKRHAAALARVDEAVAAVMVANEPSVLRHEVGARIGQVATLSFTDPHGRTVRPIGHDELFALTVERGSLTPSERVEIQQHVTHTYDFLVRIPWSRDLQGVPEIAGKHHEYLDGTGYPARLPAPAIPLQARMMTVADIFDALTASDRPYKRAVPVPHALDILRAEAGAGKVDARVLDLFVEARVFEALGVPRV